jgi:hypothetical protein
MEGKLKTWKRNKKYMEGKLKTWKRNKNTWKVN